MQTMKRIENTTFDEERALYGSRGIQLAGCSFSGPADGESALKEASWIQADHCFFNLRYPFWHDDHVLLENSEMTELCRAAIWYTRDMTIRHCRLHGIKALRECDDIHIEDCDIVSPEFGWNVRNIQMKDSHAVSEYFMMGSRNLSFDHVELNGKYSFQYIENARFESCCFQTKDAFWRGKNIYISNSTIRGEYLGWYSENVTFENCTIIGTQPLCYCRNLKLIHCTMIDADLAFEKSDVQAQLDTPILSIKNPASGRIAVPAAGQIIMDDSSALGEIILTNDSRAQSDCACCCQA